MKLYPYLKIIRTQNAVMTAIAVLLGNWIADTNHPANKLILLIIAAITSIGFGNVINDIVDIETDKISHPYRPIPKGEISKHAAIIYTIFLFCFSILCASIVSWYHAVATITPLLLLIIYSIYLKGTPLSGNILVSLLVAYPLLYGGLGGSSFSILIIPAILAFLLNFSREIIKDLEDYEGDSAIGLITSASLPANITKTIIITNSILYLSIIFLPLFFKQLGLIYFIVCLSCALPIHIIRSRLILMKKWPNIQHRKIASLYKIEMFFGLAALLFEKIL